MSLLTIYEVGGALVTLALAVLIYLRSSDDAKKTNVAFVTVLGLIFTMLLSLRFDVLPKMSHQYSLAGELAATPRLEQLLHETSEAVRIADSSNEPLMKYILDLRLNALQRHTDAVRQGRFVVAENEMPEFALAMIQSAKTSILATSYVQFNQWWDTPWGKRYEELNAEAIKRGVKITRVFIFSNKSDFETAKPHLDTQSKAGIDVRFVMSRDLGVQITSDMVVVDNRLAGELVLTPEKGMKEAEFRTRSVDIREVSARINRVLLDSEPNRTK
jgi:hypothetical protein